MAYATYQEVEVRVGRVFSETEIAKCTSLLNRAALMIDSFVASVKASAAAKQEVSINMVSRVMAGDEAAIPIGATQGSISGLGYAQSWTMSNGSTGELYFSKDDKRLLDIGNAIGSYSPVQELARCCHEDDNNTISC